MGFLFLATKTSYVYVIIHVCMLVSQLCPALCNHMDYSPRGSSDHGIPQARILKWVTIPFSRGSSPPVNRTWIPALQADSLYSEPPPEKLKAYIQNILFTHFFFHIMDLKVIEDTQRRGRNCQPIGVQAQTQAVPPGLHILTGKGHQRHPARA